ncbi:MAG: hypothetical protein ABI910_21460 [Gemmatimonadota bacterium]
MRFPSDIDFNKLASLLVQVVQHAEWERKPLSFHRHDSELWSERQRYANILARHGLVRVVAGGDVFQVSLSSACAAEFDRQRVDGAALRSALMDVVKHRVTGTCQAMVEGLSDRMHASRPATN